MIKELEWYTIKVDMSEDHFFKFEIYEVHSKLNGEINSYGATESGYTTGIESVDPIAEGHIKWDGCSNWSMFPHFCGRRSLEQFKEALDTCYDIGEEHGLFP